MAHKTIASSLMKDKQSATLHSPPKMSSSYTSDPDFTEDCEILFQASNVLNTYDNLSLSFLENEMVPVPPNAPTDDPELSTKMKRREANKMYAARYRQRKEAKIHQLEKQNENLQAEVSSLQYRLFSFESAYNNLMEENAQLKAYGDAVTELMAEKEAENGALTQELYLLKNNQNN